MADIANRAKEVAKEDAERIKVLAQDAFQSRAYLYPIKVWISTINHLASGIHTDSDRVFTTLHLIKTFGDLCGRDSPQPSRQQ
jgi:hypothetical protein